METADQPKGNFFNKEWHAYIRIGMKIHYAK